MHKIFHRADDGDPFPANKSVWQNRKVTKITVHTGPMGNPPILSIFEATRVQKSECLRRYLNPNNFSEEIRRCALWKIHTEYRSIQDFDAWIPVNDKIYPHHMSLWD